MRERIFQAKKAASPVSISTLKQPTRGFGLESLNASPPAMTQVQPLNKPLSHDISKISLRPQAKLSISQPGDAYEQEADTVARQVIQRMALSGNRQSIQRQEVPEEEEELQMKPLDITTLQRQEAPEEEEELQMKPLDITTLQRQEVPEEEEELQMKPLDISTLQRQEAPEEEEELQMKPLDISTIQRQEVPEEEEELQMKPLDISTIQRQEAPEEEEELQMKPMVQRQANGGMAATADLETSINQARGGGQPLGDDIKEPMEQAFGADFGGVKVHTDSQSHQLNQSIQARAFTTGQDIFFRQGEYNPGSRGGQELLAHELTHVVQQSGGMVQRSPFPNKMKENFDQELTEANQAAIESKYENGPGPYAQGTKGFDAFINKGLMFKWIFNEKNGLVVISPTLKHSVAAAGGEAITAGHGQKTEKGKIWINNDTGHYQTTLESLDLSLPAWQNAGYQVETRERTDFAAVFNNMGGGQQQQCNIM